MRLEFKPDMSGYDLVLCRDLFGAFILYRRWFGLNNHRGSLKQQVFDDRDDALRTIKRIRHAREKNGYRLVSQAG